MIYTVLRRKNLMYKEFKRDCKRNLAILLLTGFSINAVCGAGVNESIKNTNMGNFVSTLMTGLSGIVIGAVGGVATYKYLSNSSAGNCDSTAESWNDVAKKWMKAHRESAKDSPESFEALAEYNRCLTYMDKEKCDEAVKNYREASKRFLERSEREDKSSDRYKLDTAKAAEMKAKAAELRFDYGDCKDHCCRCQYGSCRTMNYRLAWNNLIGKKPSYDAYAKAKQAEAQARLGYREDGFWGDNPDILNEVLGKSSQELWRIAADRWEDVKNDEDLKNSFSTRSWIAFQALAEATKKECLFKCGEATKEDVAKAWADAYVKDCKCAKEYNNSRSHYEAFAAEAFLKCQLAMSSDSNS